MSKANNHWTQEHWEGFRQGVLHRKAKEQKMYYTDRYGQIMFRSILGERPAANKDYAIGYMAAFLVGPN